MYITMDDKKANKYLKLGGHGTFQDAIT